jgi:hypothetical protein
MLTACGLGVLAVAAGLMRVWPHDAQPALEKLWRPVLEQSEPLLIFVPILPERGEPTVLTDRVGIGATHGAVKVASLMTSFGKRYTLKMGSELSFADLRRQPAVLLGAYSHYWTSEFNQDLRIGFQPRDATYDIVDHETGNSWRAKGEDGRGYALEDYALVSRLMDSRSGQALFLAAGITTFGTQSAAELLTDSSMLGQLVKAAPRDWERKNFQAVLHTRIIGTTPGPPQVVAQYFW